MAVAVRHFFEVRRCTASASARPDARRCASGYFGAARARARTRTRILPCLLSPAARTPDKQTERWTRRPNLYNAPERLLAANNSLGVRSYSARCPSGLFQISDVFHHKSAHLQLPIVHTMTDSRADASIRVLESITMCLIYTKCPVSSGSNEVE